MGTPEKPDRIEDKIEKDLERLEDVDARKALEQADTLSASIESTNARLLAMQGKPEALADRKAAEKDPGVVAAQKEAAATAEKAKTEAVKKAEQTQTGLETLAKGEKADEDYPPKDEKGAVETVDKWVYGTKTAKNPETLASITDADREETKPDALDERATGDDGSLIDRIDSAA